MNKTLKYAVGAAVLAGLVLVSLGCQATLTAHGSLLKKDAKVASERAADGVLLAKNLIRAGFKAGDVEQFLVDRGYSKDEAKNITMIAATDFVEVEKTKPVVQ